MFDRKLIKGLAEQIALTLPQCGSTRVVTIDGPAGSGKTTLGSALAEELGDCQLVHMDDLYEGWQQDLVNVLPERINSWILVPLSNGLPGQYLKYNWYSGKYDEIVAVPVTRYLILEGVGSGNTKLNSQTSFNIWVEANSANLLDRLVQRDGKEMLPRLTLWQRHEAEYFDLVPVRTSADVLIKGD